MVVSGAQAPFNLYAIKPTHVWTGGSGDDFSTVENWVDASGNAVTAAPTADSVVYIPAAQDTDVTNTVVVSVARSMLTARGLPQRPRIRQTTVESTLPPAVHRTAGTTSRLRWVNS